jgi:hypothetical protein
MRLRPILACALAAALALAGPAAAQAAQGDSLLPQSLTPPSQTEPPPGFALSPREASEIASAVPEVARQGDEHPRLRSSVLIPTYVGDGDRYEVSFRAGDDSRVEVHVDGRTGAVLEVWTGPQIEFPLARGYEPSVGGPLNKPYVWLTLAVLFLAPFFDPRRPFRLVHLDLLMLLGFGLSQLWFNRGEIDVSVPLAYPFLAYFLVRLLLAGFRPRERRGPLVPYAPTALLVVGLVLLVGGRVALNVADSSVIDVGYASVVGADRIEQDLELYTDNEVHGDAYGPFNYVAYVPFERLWPTTGEWDEVPAAHAAAIFFDLLVLLGLFLLGRQLRSARLGVALAFAWAAFPFSTYVLQSNTNDGLTAALIVFAVLALRSPAARGAITSLGVLAKFVVLPLVPLLAAGSGERRPRQVVTYGLAFATITVAGALAYLPDGGLRELYDATLGYQLSRESPFSLWGLHPELQPVQDVLKVGAVALAAALFFVPRERDARQVAALAGAVVIAFQLAATHWFYFYIAWFAPLVLVASFAAQREPEPDAEPGTFVQEDRPALAAAGG